MKREATVTRTIVGKETPVIPPTGEISSPRSERIVLRNHDHEFSYEVSVTVTGESGEIIYNKQHYLLPQEYDSILQSFPEDRYSVEASFENQREALEAVQLDENHEHSAMIEMGNGTLSLTKGL